MSLSLIGTLKGILSRRSRAYRLAFARCHVSENNHLGCFLPLALPPCSNPFLHIKIIRNPQMQIPYYWHAERDFSSATRLSRHKWLTHVGKNSPPDCFLPQIFRFAPSLFESLSIQKNNTKPTKADFALLAR